jgi:hypothetical protein
MPEPLPLAEALEKQRQDNERLLLRGVRAFANRLRLVGFAAILVGGLLTLAIQAWARAYHLAWLGYVMGAFLTLTWLYAAGLLGVFWWRTRFTAYLLKTHWTWLAVLVGVPIDMLLGFAYRLHVPAWLLLILVGGLFWRWRTIRAEEECRACASQWRRLFSLTWNDLLLLRFPNLHAGSADGV